MGSSLVHYGFDHLREKGADVAFVYGDPHYYGRFGFTVQDAVSFLPPYTLKYPTGWQATLLNDRKVLLEPVTVSCVGPLMNAALW